MEPADNVQVEKGKNRWQTFPVAATAIMVVVLASIAYAFLRPESRNTAQVSDPVPAVQSPVVSQGEVKEFVLTAMPFEYSVKEIRVKKGDRVRIVLKNEKGMHDWVVDEFNVRTKQLKVGETDTVEFVADKAGTFEYYCSVPTHRQMGMVGKLIVE